MAKPEYEDLSKGPASMEIRRMVAFVESTAYQMNLRGEGVLVWCPESWALRGVRDFARSNHGKA